MNGFDWLWLAGAAVLALGGGAQFMRAKQRLAKQQAPTKNQKRALWLWLSLAVLGSLGWLARLLAANHKFPFSVELFPARWQNAFGVPDWSLSATVLVGWGFIAIALLVGLLFRFAVVPRLQDRPRGVQAVLEAAIEQIESYVGGKLHGMSDAFCAYIFSLALYLIASAVAEMLGIHAPTSDLTMTLAISLITFALVNYYGFKRKGFLGRIKSLGSIRDPVYPEGATFAQRMQLQMKAILQPTTIGFPFRVISDLVVPLSLACRLFGNMFGGMVIVNLLYYALGKYALGLPSVVGLWFHLFHPLIQTFIFITLTLAYIEEATAVAED